MAGGAKAGPPRPIAPGDVVAAYSDALGAWTAAQVTDLDAGSRLAGVLELDWAGPEPATVADLGEVAPLRLTHHGWDGALSHCNFAWVLPRSHKVIGSLPLLHHEPSPDHSSGWRLGEQLARQRHWDAGHRGPWNIPGHLECTAADLPAGAADARTDVHDLSVTGIRTLDCANLVRLFPRLTGLLLVGDLGTLTNASHLNELTALRRLYLNDLFGMTATDALRLEAVPGLELVSLNSIPAAYAAAMRSTWRPEAVNGTYLDISAPRRPDWIAENRDNPLRGWDGRDHITAATLAKAVKQYKLTRRAILDALTAAAPATPHERLTEIGRDFAEAFNELDTGGFIETEEREDLFTALDTIVDEAEYTLGHPLPQARETLATATDSTRDW